MTAIRSAQAQELVDRTVKTRAAKTRDPLIRQQVITAVGLDPAMSDGLRIHTTIDSHLQKVAEKSLRAQLNAAEQTPGYNHQTYAEYAALLKGARRANPKRKRRGSAAAGIFAGSGHRAR